MKSESEKGKTDRQLPFDGVSLVKQLEMLRAFATYFEESKLSASYTDIAPLIGMSATSVSGCLKFWRSTGVLVGEKGRFAPSAALLNFAKKKPDNSNHVLGAILKDCWFASSVKMRLKLKKSLTETEIMGTLAKTYDPSGKKKVSKKSLKMLIKLLVLAEIAEKDEKGVFLGKTDAAPIEPQIESLPMEINVPTDKNLIRVRIDDCVFVIDREALIEFIKTSGQELGEEVRLR